MIQRKYHSEDIKVLDGSCNLHKTIIILLEIRILSIKTWRPGIWKLLLTNIKIFIVCLNLVLDSDSFWKVKSDGHYKIRANKIIVNYFEGEWEQTRSISFFISTIFRLKQKLPGTVWEMQKWLQIAVYCGFVLPKRDCFSKQLSKYRANKNKNHPICLGLSDTINFAGFISEQVR